MSDPLRSSTRIEIDLSRIEQNGRILRRQYAEKGIRVTAITKGVCGAPPVALALYRSGIRSFGDARLANLRRMRQAGIQAEYVLVRPPRLSEAEHVVDLADVSLNTELTVVSRLSEWALRKGVTHRVILMLELGDRREGILAADLDTAVEATLPLAGVSLAGIGTNLACLNGVIPSAEKMQRLSAEAARIEKEYGIALPVISGGNSANHDWLANTQDVGRINNLRIGEALLLGREAVRRRPIDGLSNDAFCLVGEVIEVKTKPSRPSGRTGLDAMGRQPVFQDQGSMRRAIVALGAQDIDPSGVRPRGDLDIVGACSDQLVLHDRAAALHVGSEVRFDLTYSALLRVMTSPYVHKAYLATPRQIRRPGQDIHHIYQHVDPRTRLPSPETRRDAGEP